jgi:predicted CoA-substrate-specific enzyme activase
MLGVDLGSRCVKIVEMVQWEQGVRQVRTEVIDTVAFYRTHGVRASGSMRIDFSALGFAAEHPIVATGYGKIAVPVDGARQVPEIKAHVRGAVYQSKLLDFTLLDIGGQDTKVVQVSGGKIADFQTNDRCAASSGRYVENMAGILEVDMETMGLFYEDAAELNATCAVFGETEIIAKIAAGYSTAQLIAGVNYSLYRRLAAMLERLAGEVVVLSGGGSRSPALAEIIRRERRCEVYPLPQPHLNGALGCCLLGFDQAV